MLLQDRMNEINAPGGAQITAEDPAGPWGPGSNAHMAMHRWYSTKGILTPDVPQPTSPLAEAPPPAAQLTTSKA